MGQGRSIIKQLHFVIWSEYVSSKTRRHMYTSLFDSSLLYGVGYEQRTEFSNSLELVEMVFS